MPLSLVTPRLTGRLRSIVAAVVLSAAALPAMALPLMDLHLEDLLPMAPDFKKELNLNANQATLWQQTESRSRQIMRDRLSRRQKLQEAMASALTAKQVELRDLVGAVDAETATSAAEEKQMREWWLTVNDALNETQRRQVAEFLGEQLMRVADSGNRPARDKEDAPVKSGGHHRGGAGGGAGGAGGVGGSVGGNGGSVTIPGM